MTQSKIRQKHPAKGISCILPTYNESSWLRDTIDAIFCAVSYAKISNFELIVVDDGSIDETPAVVMDMAQANSLSIVLIRQPNQGRFYARYSGIKKAKYDDILLVDSRVHIDKRSLDYILREKKRNPGLKAWNGHVEIEKNGNPYARFWSAVTGLFWSDYLTAPRQLTYGITNFDNYPKGTGFFYAPKKDLMLACKKFLQKSGSLRYSSDDTHLLRHIAMVHGITIDPNFACKYYSRDSFIKFMKHGYYRGQFFVDGYLRRNTRFYMPLIATYITNILLLALVLLAAVIKPVLLFGLPISFLILCCIIIVIGLKKRVSQKDVQALIVLLPSFASIYLLGLWVGLGRRMGLIKD